MTLRTELQRNRRAVTIVTACLIAAGSGVIMSYQLYGTMPIPKPSNTAQSDTDTPTIAGTLQKGTPTYKTILPAGHTIADFGGWTRVSPPKRDPVYAYADHIGAIPIIVSEQPIPKDWRDGPDGEVRSLADTYGASKTLKAGSTTVYSGVSAKGPQSIIFIKNGLLVLIKASAAVPDGQWQEYIQSLS